MQLPAPHRLPAGTRPASPDQAYAPVTPEDPAAAVMTDLRRHRTVTVGGAESLAFAERLMIHAGVRLLLVLDAAGSISGVVTYRDLTGEAALAAAARERVVHAELPVAQVMTPAAETEALDYADVAHLRVSDLARLMRERGRQHALVTEKESDGRTVVRGIFSITQIGRQLGVTIEASGRVQSFAEIEHLIAGA